MSCSVINNNNADKSLLCQNCQNCEHKDLQIQFLLEKIHLLEDIVNTSKVIDQLNQSLFSNLSDKAVQTDDFEANSEVEYCGVYDMESYILADSQGQIQIPDSFISTSKQCYHSKSVDKGMDSAQNIQISPISSLSDLSNLKEIPHNNSTDCIQPIAVYEDAPAPFHNFSFDKLLSELIFSHDFKNRKAVYYGEFPYRYNGGSHDAKYIQKDSYLAYICCHLDALFPDFEYNSALVHLYESGKDFILAHSDSEDCIEDDSDIITVSLGATRTFKISDAKTGKTVHSVNLKHGDITVMSKASQAFFKHELIPDPSCLDKRISITFRLIKPVVPTRGIKATNNATTEVTSRVSDNSRTCDPYNLHNKLPNARGYVPYNDQVGNSDYMDCTAPPRAPSAQYAHPNTPSTALYISSSMFRHLDTDKLSSKGVNAKKLFYPGADASIMLRKLKADIDDLDFIPSLVYVMCGTNNIESIYYGSKSLQSAADDIKLLIKYIKNKFPSAQVNVINILPRLKKGRNDVVNELNYLIEQFCVHRHITFMSTKHLFNFKDGKRIEKYFMAPSHNVADNCHLNNYGVARLGKFVKYWTHKNAKEIVEV